MYCYQENGIFQCVTLPGHIYKNDRGVTFYILIIFLKNYSYYLVISKTKNAWKDWKKGKNTQTIQNYSMFSLNKFVKSIAQVMQCKTIYVRELV